MDKIVSWLGKLPHDKALHSVYGTIVFALMLVVVQVWIAFGVVVVVAIMKEVYDQWKYKGADWKDIVATVVVPLALVMVI